MRNSLALIAILAAVPAGAWTLDSNASTISYVSIKNADTAEPNLLPQLSGGVGEDGTARIEIDLASVETYIDIRNERMKEHLFKVADYPVAALEAALDMAALEKLKSGATAESEFDVTVSANGEVVDYPVLATVTRVGDDRVMVVSREPVILYADEFGWDTGLNALREIAGLDSIQLAVPVNFTLVFDR